MPKFLMNFTISFILVKFHKFDIQIQILNMTNTNDHCIS